MANTNIVLMRGSVQPAAVLSYTTCDKLSELFGFRHSLITENTGHITRLNILPAAPPDDLEAKPATYTTRSVSGSVITIYLMRVPLVPGLISFTFMSKIACLGAGEKSHGQISNLLHLEETSWIMNSFLTHTKATGR